MNKIPQRNDWRIELQAIALLALLIVIVGGLLWLGAATGGWGAI